MLKYNEIFCKATCKTLNTVSKKSGQPLMRWFPVGISPHLKMVRFRFILIMLSLLKSGCLEKRVQWYKIASNVAVDWKMCAEHESTTDEISIEIEVCVQKCQEMEQVISPTIEDVLYP